MAPDKKNRFNLLVGLVLATPVTLPTFVLVGDTLKQYNLVTPFALVTPLKIYFGK